jgi:hypothetical protein
MFVEADLYEGIPSRLYRAPGEIREDILSVKEKIKEIDGSLSVHDLLMEFISEWAKEEPGRWIGELEELLAEAKESLKRLEELNQILDGLREELEDSKWIIGR